MNKTSSSIFTDYDLHLFGEGNLFKVYEKMGAHISEHNGVKGINFTVWAPNAETISVIGSFNNWDGREHKMQPVKLSGIWELFVPGVKADDLYKFAITDRNGATVNKADPYAFKSEHRPKKASIVTSLDGYKWRDENWINLRTTQNRCLEKPMSIYEVHLGSWMRDPKDLEKFLTYLEIADKLIPYVKRMGYTHVELTPVTEFPYDKSWGYQVTGYFSATTRYGSPHELMNFIDQFHRAGIGVILDWVPAHFPKDEHGLAWFDGTALYGHEDPRQGEIPDWGTRAFNHGRNEVVNFLISSAMFWIDKYHFDGLRVDAVAAMLFRDYSRKDGEWVPNKYGGNENIEAIEFMKKFNYAITDSYPDVMTFAEDSSAFLGLTDSLEENGIGFTYKWNLGWMNDTLEYLKRDPIHRKHHHSEVLFSFGYMYDHNFCLTLSHDEVVHLKKSLLGKMPGDDWQKFANLRMYLAFMFAHPGKMLNFMGNDIGQWKEWDEEVGLDWHLLEDEQHRKLNDFVRTLNHVYADNPAFWELDYSPAGFKLINGSDSENSVISFARKSRGGDYTVCVFNMTPIPRYDYKVCVDHAGEYKEILNSDSEEFFGTNALNQGMVIADTFVTAKIGSGKVVHGEPEHSISVTLPPLGAVFLKLSEITVEELLDGLI